MYRIYHREATFVANGFEVCKTSNVPGREHRRKAAEKEAAERQKDLILFVRSRRCGELNRGLQNLGAPCEGVRLVTFCIVQKVTKKHTGLRPATSIQSSVGNTFGEAFQRHVPKPFFRTKRRRKGFESVRGSGVTA